MKLKIFFTTVIIMEKKLNVLKFQQVLSKQLNIYKRLPNGFLDRNKDGNISKTLEVEAIYKFWTINGILNDILKFNTNYLQD